MQRETLREEEFSSVVLAGGKSSRMGREKAFLTFNDRSFVSIIVEEMKHFSDNVYVLIGEKDQKSFASTFQAGKNVKLLNDSYRLDGPLGGLLTAFDKVDSRFVTVAPCDSPFLKHEIFYVMKEILEKNREASAVIPVWPSSRLEPLLAIYKSSEAKQASLGAISEGKKSCKDMISKLQNPCLVEIDSFHAVDPDLESFLNLNTFEDYIDYTRTRGLGKDDDLVRASGLN